MDKKQARIKPDVAIVGGGLAGLALAVALRAARLSVALVEGSLPLPAPATTDEAAWDARIYAVTPANARFLADIGVWPHLPAARIGPVRRMEIQGDAGGRLEFSAYDSGVAELAWIVEAATLRDELWQSAKRQANLHLLCPAQPQALELDEQAARLRLADGREIEARLIVAADGANSWTRAAAGIEVDFHHYEQHGVVANFSCARPHRDTAFQWFREDGVLAWLPLPGQRFSMVWSTPPDHARALTTLDGPALCAKVAAAGENRLGDLQLITPAQSFPLRLMRAPHCVAPRLALIGDAAHTIHPLSGHGINLGFQDAQSLAQTLSDCPAHVDCGEVRWLRRHERARKEEVVALQSVTDGLQRLFSAHNSSPLRGLRNAGLTLAQQAPGLRAFLARYATGY